MIVQNRLFSLKAVQVYIVSILFYAIVYMVLMILPFYALALGASRSEIGFVMGITMFVSMIVRPLAGNIIDRYGTKKVFVMALLIFAISLLGYFLPHLWIFGVVRAIQGVVAAFFSSAMEIIIMDLLSESMRAQGLSLYSLSTMIPTTFAPIFTLMLKDWLPLFYLFLLLFIIGIGNFLFGLLIAKQISPPSRSKHSGNPSERSSWKNQILFVSSVIMLFASIANGAIFTFLPLYLEENGSTFAEVYFLLQTLILIFFRFWGRKWIPSDGTIPYAILLLTLMLVAAGTMMIGTHLSPIWLSIAAICNGIAFALLYPALLTYVSLSVPQQRRGTLIGLFIGATDFGFAAGAGMMGIVADHFSFSAMFVTCALCCLFSIILVPGYRNSERKRAHDSPSRHFSA
jgi:MFS family permease